MAADRKLLQLIQQKIDRGEPPTAEEEAILAEEEQKVAPSSLSSLQKKAEPTFAPPKASIPAPSLPKKEEPPKASPPPAPSKDTYEAKPWADRSKEIGALRAEMPAEQRSSFDKEYASIDSLRERAIDAYRENKKSADWGRVAEMLGRAVLKLAAGYSGLKSGQDMSGAVESGEKWDWKTDYSNMKDELNVMLDTAEGRRKSTERKEDRVSKELADTTGVMRKERSELESDIRKRDTLKEAHKGDAAKEKAKTDAEKSKEDRFYAAKNLEAVQKELDALNSARAGISKKGKLSRDAIATDLAGFGIEIGSIPEAKGALWGTKGSDSVDANALNQVLVAHEKKLRERQAQLLQGSKPPAPEAPAGAEEERLDQKTGKTAIFKDKQFVRWKK